MAVMSSKKCCVPGCSQTKEALHRFPNPVKDKERFDLWINSVGGDILFQSNEFIHKCRRICSVHFEENYFCRNNRISRAAIPTIMMNCSYSYTENRQTPESKNESSTSALQGSSSDTSSKSTEVTTPMKSHSLLESLPIVLQDDTVVPEDKNLSWQKPNEVITILDDDDQMGDHPDIMSMYIDEDDLPSPRPDHDTTSKYQLTPHVAFWCNVCKAPITGFRYTCVQCSDLDLCGACEADTQHSQHYVLRVPALRPITEVQSVLATIRRHLMHKLDPINEPEQDCGDAVSVKSEVKSEVDSDNDASKTQLDDDGSRTSSQALEYEYLDDDNSTDSIDAIQTAQAHAEEPVVTHEFSSETNITAESKTAIHTTGKPERDKESPPSGTDKTILLMGLSDFIKINKSPAPNTKHIQSSGVKLTKDLLKLDTNEANEMSQIQFETIIKDRSLQALRRKKCARMVHMKGVRFFTVPGHQYMNPGCLVNLKLPPKMKQYAGPKRPVEPRAASGHHTIR